MLQEQEILVKPWEFVKVVDSNDIKEIWDAFWETMYVPDERLKIKILEELITYIALRLNDELYKMKIFISYQNSEITGVVMGMIHPTYSSYGRKCGTFGWLNARNFDSCKELIKSCERFVKENGLRKIRGNINFPKGLGGLGIQTYGFNEQMMYGVAFNSLNSRLIEFLEKLGYKKDSRYECIKITTSSRLESWDSGKIIDKNIRIGYLTLKEMRDRKEEFHDLIAKSFLGSLPFPDASGRYRLDEILNTYAKVPLSHYKIRHPDFNPKDYSKCKREGRFLKKTRYHRVHEFEEVWNTYDLEKVVTWAPLAFDKKTGEIVGAILSVPDLYEDMLGGALTRNNIDTIMVNKKYSGKRIYTNLNNIGELTCRLHGMTYYEGTTIFYNNPDAIKSVFPYGTNIRTHYVMQKRVKNKK